VRRPDAQGAAGAVSALTCIEYTSTPVCERGGYLIERLCALAVLAMQSTTTPVACTHATIIVQDIAHRVSDAHTLHTLPLRGAAGTRCVCPTCLHSADWWATVGTTVATAVNIFKQAATASQTGSGDKSGSAALPEHPEQARSRKGQAQEAGAKKTATAARNLSDMLEM
jgi:hypothetical protein